MQGIRIREFTLYDFVPDQKATKQPKTYYTKDEGTVDRSTVIRRFKKFCSECKNLEDLAKSGRRKNVDSEVLL